VQLKYGSKTWESTLFWLADFFFFKKENAPAFASIDAYVFLFLYYWSLWVWGVNPEFERIAYSESELVSLDIDPNMSTDQIFHSHETEVFPRNGEHFHQPCIPNAATVNNAVLLVFLQFFLQTKAPYNMNDVLPATSSALHLQYLLLSLIWNINWAKVSCPSCLENEKKKEKKKLLKNQNGWIGTKVVMKRSPCTLIFLCRLWSLSLNLAAM
jgi:hypothetical protein